MCIKCDSPVNANPRYKYWQHKQELFDLIYEGKITPNELHRKTVIGSKNGTFEAIKEGSGLSFDGLTEANRHEYKTLAGLELNAFTQASFKNKKFIENTLMDIHPDGVKLGKKAAKLRFDVLHKKYYKDWQQAEENLARQISVAKKDWADIQNSKDFFPYLRYNTAEDERVRQLHRELDDVIKPVDDPFWKTWFPPNGYNCRCYTTKEVFDDNEAKPLTTTPEKIDFFARNFGEGKPMQTFDDTFPYMDETFLKQNRILNNSMAAMLNELEGYFDATFKGVEGSVKSHVLLSQQEIEKNVLQANRLVQKGETIYLQPELNEQIYSGFKGFKNADFYSEGLASDFKMQSGKSLKRFVQSSIESASQGYVNKVIIQPLTYNKTETIEALLNAIVDSNGVERNKNVKVIVLQWDLKNYPITRDEIIKGKWELLP